MKNINDTLYALGYNKKEQKYLLDNHSKTTVEELIVLLSSFEVKNLKKYIKENKYLLTKNIFDLAYFLTNTFNIKKDYEKTIKSLKKDNFNYL